MKVAKAKKSSKKMSPLSPASSTKGDLPVTPSPINAAAKAFAQLNLKSTKPSSTSSPSSSPSSSSSSSSPFKFFLPKAKVAKSLQSPAFLLIPLAVEIAATDPHFFFTVFRCINRKIRSFVHQNRQSILDGIKQHPRAKRYIKFVKSRLPSTLESFTIRHSYSLSGGSADAFKFFVKWAPTIQLDWIVIASHFDFHVDLDEMLTTVLPTASDSQRKRLTKTLLLYFNPSGSVIRVLEKHGIHITGIKTPREKLDFVIRLGRYAEDLNDNVSDLDSALQISPRYYIDKGFNFSVEDMIKLLDDADSEQGVVRESYEIPMPAKKPFRHLRPYDLKSYDLMNFYIVLWKNMKERENELKAVSSSPSAKASAEESPFLRPGQKLSPEITDSGHRKELANFLNHLLITCAKWEWDGNSLVCFAFHHHPFTTPPDKVIAQAIQNAIENGNTGTFDSILVHLLGPCTGSATTNKTTPPLPPIVEKTLVNMIREGSFSEFGIDTFLDSEVISVYPNVIKSMIKEGMACNYVTVVAMLLSANSGDLSKAFLKQLRDFAKATGMKTMLKLVEVAMKDSAASHDAFESILSASKKGSGSGSGSKSKKST